MRSGKIKLTFAIGLIILAIIWILQNGGAVTMKFLFVTVTMPQTLLLAITLLVGIAVGILLALHQVTNKNKKYK